MAASPTLNPVPPPQPAPTLSASPSAPQPLLPSLARNRRQQRQSSTRPTHTELQQEDPLYIELCCVCVMKQNWHQSSLQRTHTQTDTRNTHTRTQSRSLSLSNYHVWSLALVCCIPSFLIWFNYCWNFNWQETARRLRSHSSACTPKHTDTHTQRRRSSFFSLCCRFRLFGVCGVKSGPSSR